MCPSPIGGLGSNLTARGLHLANRGLRAHANLALAKDNDDVFALALRDSHAELLTNITP